MAPPHPTETATARRKTSLKVDFDKVDAARELLGTRTLVETVEAALDEIVNREQRRKLVELLHTPGVLDLDDPDVMAGAWR
jgi:hypothetical protein